MSDPVIWSLDDRGIARVTLDRPEVNNAYDGSMIEGLHAALDALAGEARPRVVVIAGSGRHFQAGADLNWLNAVRVGSPDENLHASRRTAEAMDRLNRLPVPTIALVQGFCVGGGTGLVAACDVAIAAQDATFAISEVRWGLTAAIIVPLLCDAIGARQVRRYALTGERFTAEDARRIGLVHDVVPATELDAAGERIATAFLANGPEAMAETKAAVLECSSVEIGADLVDTLITAHARKRQSNEAAEGLASFVEKRPARW